MIFCSWHVLLLGGLFFLDCRGVSMFQWQWMFLSFSVNVFNLHWRVCPSVPVREKILDMKIRTTVSVFLKWINLCCTLRPIVLMLLSLILLYPSNVRSMLDNCLWERAKGDNYSPALFQTNVRDVKHLRANKIILPYLWVPSAFSSSSSSS